MNKERKLKKSRGALFRGKKFTLKLWFICSLLVFGLSPHSWALAPCQHKFISLYTDLQNSFVSLYYPRPLRLEVESLREKLSFFLQKFPQKKCLWKNKVLRPQGDVERMLREMEEKERVFSFGKFPEIRNLPQGVYGEDNRQEVEEVPHFEMRQWAHSTLAQINLDHLVPNAHGESFEILSPSLGERYSLCPQERFYHQPSAAKCSGFLVAPDMIMTAGHCLWSERDCRQFVWAFDFFKGVDQLKRESVYQCQKILKRVVKYPDGLDYALVQLDRKVVGRKLFRWRKKGRLQRDEPLVMIGHPGGLPTKMVDGAKVVKTLPRKHYFMADLDAFEGNSGSVVINERTGEVEGLLIKGGEDYEWIEDGPSGQGCFSTKVCPQEGCPERERQEEVMKITSLKELPRFLFPFEIKKALWEEQSLPEVSFGLPWNTYAYSLGDYFIGGSQFLDYCALSLARVDEPHQWIDSLVLPCSREKEIMTFLEKFEDLVFFSKGGAL